MKIIPFEKYQGAGNDFVILDFYDHGEFLDLNDQVFMEQLCDRRFGIGADGIIALCKKEGYDFEMKYLNSDGRFSTFCGNGSRCISMYAYRKWAKDYFSFIAADGPHESFILSHDQVKVKMLDIDSFQITEQGAFVNSGSPHLILYVQNVFEHPIRDEGRQLRNSFSKEGANVNFIESISETKIKIATYERGVEDETLACGTGITAAAYYHAIKNKLKGNNILFVMAKGGECKVELNLNSENQAKNVFLTGPAQRVYSGFWTKKP